MRTPVDDRVFQTGLTTLLGGANDIGDDRLSEQLANYLDAQMQPWGGINREYAAQSFREHLQSHGRDTIAECVSEWAEECADGIRWPVAFVYIASPESTDRTRP